MHTHANVCVCVCAIKVVFVLKKLKLTFNLKDSMSMSTYSWQSYELCSVMLYLHKIIKYICCLCSLLEDYNYNNDIKK